MTRTLPLLILLVALCGCRSYTESTPRETFEGDNVTNYRRVFKDTIPSDVSVLNSVVVGYARRPGVVTTDDYAFELIVPASWVERWKKTLRSNTLGIQARKDRPIRPWYAPKPLDAYETFRDLTSVGYVHLLVEKQREPDGRCHVFFSKH